MSLLKRRNLLRIAQILLILEVSTSVCLAALDRQVRPDKTWHETRYQAVGGYVNHHSTPNDGLFVWGNSPAIYQYSGRIMATRYLSVNYQTGRTWGTPSNERNGAADTAHVPPESWTHLLADLEARPPLFIVDAAAGGLDNMKRDPLGKFPRIAAFVSSRYQQVTDILGVPIYRRK